MCLSHCRYTVYEPSSVFSVSRFNLNLYFRSVLSSVSRGVMRDTFFFNSKSIGSSDVSLYEDESLNYCPWDQINREFLLVLGHREVIFNFLY